MVERVARHDVLHDLARSYRRTQQRGEQRHAVVNRARSEPQRQHRSDAQRNEPQALQQAKRTRQLV
jgi:hypothetical protein